MLCQTIITVPFELVAVLD